MNARQFAEYRAMYRIAPWGDDWRQAGEITAAIYNSQRTKGRALHWRDFLPVGSRPTQTAEQVENVMSSIAAGVNRQNA